MDDKTLILRIQNGDVDAFAPLVQKYHRHLLAFIFHLVRDRQLTEDIGQEVFLDVYKSLPSFDTERGAPFSAWLYTFARNRCISELRKTGRREMVPMEDHTSISAGGATAEEALIGHEERQALASSLEQLSEPFRTTIMMSLEGASLRDIAQRCGVSQSTVKTRLFRAREKVRQLVKVYIGGIAHARRI